MSGLDRLGETIAQLQGKTLAVGFMAGATYPDGTSVAKIAVQNEYGGVIKIPAHTVTVYRKVLPTGEFAKNGRFVKKSQSNFATDHLVESYEINIPPRPFMRNMVSKEKGTWAAKLGNCMIASHYNVDNALNMLGEDMKGALQESINTFTEPKLAPSTIAKKGFDKPLIHTGDMLRAVTFEVRNS